MKKICKKLLIIFMALAMSVSALALSACDYSAKGLDGAYQNGEVESQGGWVVKKGDYVYFINGMTSAPTDEDGNSVAYENKYGDVVRGALMRIKAADMDKGDYSKVETVVPLLFVAADYTSGIFIYGDYVYYATPTTAKNLEGETETNYVDFKRSRLDGKETMRDYYFRSDDATSEYRFVEVDKTVYCLHMDGDDLYSYNTVTREDTLLAKDTASHVFHKTDVSDPYVYYTMKVTEDIDKENSVEEDYNQVYRVRADASYTLDKKTASYTVKDGTSSYRYAYSFDKDSLEKIAEERKEHEKEHGHSHGESNFNANDITTYPYVNLGQVVLDGRGRNDEKTQFNHSDSAPYTPDGYTYTLLGYENDGLYYRRTYVSGTGESGWTFYLAEEKYAATAWDTVTGNAATDQADFGGANEVIALTTGNVGASSLFYIKNNTHYYLYINNTNIVRAEVGKNGANVSDGSVANEVTVGKAAYATSLLKLDNSDETYKYVYYTVANNSGTGVGRAVYDSTEAGYAENAENFYNSIVGEDEYKPVQVLSINHVTGWYAPEILDGRVFFVDATPIGGTALNTAQIASIRKDGGAVMNNKELKAYNELMKTAETTLVDAADVSDKLSNALYYYYYTGESALFQEVIDEYAEQDGSGEYSLFSADEQAYFHAYVNKEKYEKGKISVDFSTKLFDEDGNYYGVRSYFYHIIGVLSEEEEEDLAQVWKLTYMSGISEQEEGLPTWAWVLIGIAIGVGVIGVACAVIIPLVLHDKKKKQAEAKNAPKRKQYTVDMTYDENIDVYSDEETLSAEPVEAATEAVVEEPVEEPVESAVEETADGSETEE